MMTPARNTKALRLQRLSELRKVLTAREGPAVFLYMSISDPEYKVLWDEYRRQAGVMYDEALERVEVLITELVREAQASEGRIDGKK